MQEIAYEEDEHLKIQEYSDSNWAGDKQYQKSTSDYIFILNRKLVIWCLKKQSTIVLLSIKAEYIAWMLAEKKAIWLPLLLIELDLLDSNKQYAKIKIRQANSCIKVIEDENIT